ncbi:MAG: glycosyltransferase family 2 protein [Ruminococcus sp.]|jgi:GT2 family glycosyltransferase
MSKILWSVDFEEIHCEDGIQYEAGGWAVGEKGEPVVFRLLADQTEEIPFLLKTEERPDVQRAIPEVTDRTDIGYRLCIKDAPVLWEKYQRIELKLSDGKTEIKILDRATEEIRNLYYDQTITWKIDVLEQVEGLMTIQGWVIGMFHDERISLEDEKGGKIPHEMMRIIRTDVNKAYAVGKEAENDQCGFQIRIRRKELNCKEVHLKFSNHLTTKEFVVDLKKFDYEHSKRGMLKEILAWKNRKENMAYIKEHGLGNFINRVKRELEPVYGDYNIWQKEHKTPAKELRKQKKHLFSYRPLISVVIPLYNTPREFLKVMIDSLLAQTYENFELCLADGSSDRKVKEFMEKQYGGEKRIHYRKLEKNGGISENTNAALAMAEGDYIMLADHDDIVAPDALYQMVRLLNEEPDLDIIYTDEDKVSMDGKKYYSPNFKSDFNIDLLRSVNYICHIFLVKSDIVKKVGGFRKEYDGAQDYDFILRCVEQTRRIGHIPKALYHWRAHPDSTAGNPQSKQYAVEAGKKALMEHYRRLGINAKVENTEIFGIYRTVYQVAGNPKVSVIILNKDHREDLEKCVCSIIEKTTYDNYEILIIENNSEDPQTFSYYEELQRRYKERVRVITWEGSFNYASINNFGAAHAKGDYFILLNNDIEVIAPGWMEEMLGCCQRDDVGIVGAKLFYPDDTIQHAGVVIGMGGIAGHVLCKADGKEYGYNARLVTMQDISAVTAACLMISKENFIQAEGFDERYTVAFNDIDLCLKVRELGLLVVFNPYVTLYHYESKSRGLEDTPEKLERFRKEVEYFQKKWKGLLQSGDPYYNVNLTLTEGDCSLRKATEKFGGETGAKRVI